jgi:transglutaminase-like putative cysteine protease
VEPEVPEVPEEPMEPENPEQPEVPEEPVEPEVPVDPENPEQPKEPVEPENPEGPEVPEEPVEPGNPGQPEEPEEPVADENWNDILFEMFKNVDTSAEFYTDKDVKSDYVFEVLRCDAQYRTGEHGVFWDTYSINQEEKGDLLSWYVYVGYSRDIDEIIRIKDDTSEREDAVAATLDYNGLSEFEKVDLINEYVCDTVDYYPEQPYPDESHTAYGALFESYAVCNGFSRLVKLLCDDMGVDCRIVRGDVVGGGGHAWNLVKVDGQWYHLDVTWNDGCGDRSAYFLIPDSYLDGDRIWVKELYPEVATAPYMR